jgi:glycosyltransferase involved in cell wall biosynthesis
MNNILLVGPYPPPYGGIASHFINIIPALKKAGFNVSVLDLKTRRKKAVREGVSIYGLTKSMFFGFIISTNPLKTFKTFLFFKKNGFSNREAVRETIRVLAVNRLVSKEKVNLVSYYSMLISYGIPALRKIFSYQGKIFMTIFGAINKDPQLYYDKKRLIEAQIKYSDLVLASSQFCADSLKLLGLDSSIVRAMYYGVKMDIVDAAEGRKQMLDKIAKFSSKKMILFCGRMNDEMGLDVVLEVVPKVLEKKRDVFFAILGAKSYLTPAALNLEKEFSEHVYVETNVSQSDLMGFYSISDIVVAPTRSRHACMGMTIKEAMAFGRPVVASNSGGIPEAIENNKTGIILDMTENNRLDPDEFAAAISSLLDNDEKRVSMGQKARERAEKLFSNEITIKRFTGFINEALKTK